MIPRLKLTKTKPMLRNLRTKNGRRAVSQTLRSKQADSGHISIGEGLRKLRPHRIWHYEKQAGGRTGKGASVEAEYKY